MGNIHTAFIENVLDPKLQNIVQTPLCTLEAYLPKIVFQNTLGQACFA